MRRGADRDHIRGNREALTPETGILVPERAPAELARAVVELAGDPARLARMRTAATQRARDLFRRQIVRA